MNEPRAPEDDPDNGPSGGPAEGSTGGPRASVEPEAATRISPGEWKRLRAAFSIEAYLFSPRALAPFRSEDGPGAAIVDLILRPEAIRDRLDRGIGPGRYAYRMEPVLRGGQTVFACHLQVGAAVRTGIGEGSRVQSARDLALADAAAAFGIGHTAPTAGPVLVDRDSWYELPDETKRQVETRRAPDSWTPSGDPPEAAPSE